MYKVKPRWYHELWLCFINARLIMSPASALNQPLSCARRHARYCTLITTVARAHIKKTLSVKGPRKKNHLLINIIVEVGPPLKAGRGWPPLILGRSSWSGGGKEAAPLPRRALPCVRRSDTTRKKLGSTTTLIQFKLSKKGLVLFYKHGDAANKKTKK